MPASLHPLVTTLSAWVGSVIEAALILCCFPKKVVRDQTACRTGVAASRTSVGQLRVVLLHAGEWLPRPVVGHAARTIQLARQGPLAT